MQTLFAQSKMFLVLVEGTQVFMVLQDEGLSEMGDFGENFPSFANLVNTTLSLLNSVVEVDPAQVIPVKYYMEPLDEAYEEEARAMVAYIFIYQYSQTIIQQDLEQHEFHPITSESEILTIFQRYFPSYISRNSNKVSDIRELFHF